MVPLSSDEILRVWETGALQPPLDRALTMLSAASPGESRAELARLCIGDRDARLLDVRARTFGREARCVVACSDCGESVEFSFDLPAVLVERPGAAAGQVSAGIWSLRFRAPSSEDVALAAAAVDPRRALAGRCLLEAQRDGEAITDPDLPSEVLERLAAAMAECDPQAEVLLDYDCPCCGGRGRTLFDVAAFLWEEIRAQARRLLMEVAVLARAYGWREADILAMSPARRRAYLELIP